ncbi:MAG: hypothetical protein OWV35_07840 [Firmicutes bacterium]|nr:hypothetical protein [Bacillota bacterium]
MAEADRLYRTILTVTGGLAPVTARTVEHGLVLDTRMNGEPKESFTPGAETALEAGTARWAAAAGAVFPSYRMPPAYKEAVCPAPLDRDCPLRGATPQRAADAERCRPPPPAWARSWANRRQGWRRLPRCHAVAAGHEDLNALGYYGSMAREDSLLGTLHRPWSDRLLLLALACYLPTRPAAAAAGRGW